MYEIGRIYKRIVSNHRSGSIKEFKMKLVAVMDYEDGTPNWGVFEMLEGIDEFKLGKETAYNMIRSFGYSTSMKEKLKTLQKGKVYNWGFVDSDYFKLAEIKNTKLARLTYPNAEISEDGEWIYV